ncbi:sodium/proton-potassium antiporter GerN (CPA2 family) [Paenibacillus taihuensis]|uniref:Sodium/proton-potassium antiporter GerN (CPA2 family) n=1 Tax=Paenibacillus taihuensis TaxID=1156355 RepID=A0A3D9Q1F6_9BACL|nr:cation:proton antiporter [Paenibacillus taihuensis]REE56422.1 sodium/proton-potassium antiporter GerN (CPA2 family) [Paenibacillus taihuensis]
MLIYQLVIILIASKLAGHISVRLGQPSVLGKLLIGIMLGPAVLGLIHETEVLKEISKIGVILLMFIAGLETDLAEFKRTGKSAAYVGISGIIVPFGLGYLTGTMLDMKAAESIFLGLLLSATSVSISVQALKEMGSLKSPEGSTILGAAVIDDVVVVIALAFVMSFTGGDVNLGLVLVKKGVFFAVAFLFSWLAVPWFLRKFSTLRVTETVISAGLVLCFSYAYFAEYTGVADIIGAYIAGVAISTTEFKHQVFEKVESISYSIFVPVFFTSIGVAVEFHGLTASSYVLIVVLSLIAIVSKLVGASIGAKLSGFRWRSALGIGAAMVSRGEVALIIASIGLEAALITKSLFAVIVVVVLVTTIGTPPMMKVFFKNSD